jgi:glycosyltransferase involved in cell wall biosynthesis
MHRVSAYIPCYNNGTNIKSAIASLRRQSRPPDEVFVVDDGSNDNSIEQAQAAGAAVIRVEKNSGRGAVRALAMQNATHELVLCVDASKELSPDFLERALPWFEDSKVAAVWGASEKEGTKLPERWMIRHMLPNCSFKNVVHRTFLSTAGAVLRKSSVMQVGNFNPSFRHREDLDLSDRLLAADCDVVYDPTLKVKLLSTESIGTVLERDWRWHCWPGKIDLRTYWIHTKRSFSQRLPRDLAARDLSAAGLTLIAPHFYFFKSRLASDHQTQIMTDTPSCTN